MSESQIQILPRITPGTSYVPTLKNSAPQQEPIHDVPTVQNTDNKDLKNEPTGENWISSHMTIIIVFAFIVVALIILIVWLIPTNIVTMPAILSAAKAAPVQLPTAQATGPPSQTHRQIVGKVSDAELDKYASALQPISETTDLELEKEAALKEASLAEAMKKETALKEEAALKKEEALKEETMKKEALKKEEKLNKEEHDDLPDLVELSDDEDNQHGIEEDNSTLIQKSFNEELNANLSELNQPAAFKPIAQYNFKGERVKVFNSKEEIYGDGFDYEAIIKCVNKEQDTHRKHRWRYL